MVITIYGQNGDVKAELAVNDSSTQVKEVQGENVLSLSFSYWDRIALDVNDYTEYCGERYWLTDRYKPTQKSDVEWEYNVKLYGVESMVKRFLVLETTDGDAEPVFTLTATPREHVAMIVRCMNAGMGGSDWKVGQVDGTDLVTVDYRGTYCDEGLKMVADAVGGDAEWWVEGQTVNVCRCETGEELALGHGKGLTTVDCDTSGTEGFYTRLFPIGSSRNIDPATYGHNRLVLPDGRKYVETHVDEYGIYDRYEEDAFSGIYPRRLGTVSSVRSEEVTDEDGTAMRVYYFTDSGLDFDPNEYELAGETKRVSFVSGELSGLGTGDDHYFEVNYDSEKREFELMTIWPDGMDGQLPGGELVPKVGDTYLMWNIRMPDSYYQAAEQELLAAVEQYNADHWRDVSAYKCATDPVWMEESGETLTVGRRVRIESEKLFPDTGYRSSRITKITRKVNHPYQMDIEVSDVLHKGAMDRVNDRIDSLTHTVVSKGEGTGLPDLIRTGDKTLPTDNNLYSALRTDRDFVSSRKDQTLTNVLTLLRGLRLVAPYYLGGDGVARLEKLIATRLQSPDYHAGTAQGLDGTGYGVTEDNERYTMEIDNLIVRMKMVIAALEVHEMTYVGGSVVLSPCGNRVDMVRACNAAGEEITDETEDQAVSYYRCYFLANDGEREVKNEWSVGQLARCKTENMVDGETVTNQDYWRLCTGVDAEAVEIGGKRYHYIDLSNNAETGMTFTVAEGGETKTYTLDDLPGVDGTLNSVPQAGDNVVGLGHAWDKSRQNAAMISAGDNIGWTLYKGIDRYALDERYVVNRFSVDETVVTTDHLVMRPYAQPDDTTTVTCMRGAYDAEKTYGHNDLVTYGGQVWICTVKLGDTVQGKEPSLTGDGKDYWAVYVAKGEDGKDGKSARRTAVVQLTSDKGTIFDKEYQDVVLKCKVWIDGKSMGGRIPKGKFDWSKDGKSNVSETEFRYRTVSSTDAINRWRCNVAIPRRLIEPIELTAVAVDGNHLIVRASEDITGMYMYPCWRARYCTRMNEGFENATRWRFHDLVHGDFGRDRIKALPMQPLGGNLYQVDMSAVLTFVETRCIVLHETSRVTTRKTALKHGAHTYWAKRGDDGKYRAWGRYGVMLAIGRPRDTMTPISTVAKCKVYITTDSDTATTGTASLSI